MRLCVSAPADESLGSKKKEAEDEKNMEELSFVPGAVSEPRWPCISVITTVEQIASSSSKLRLFYRKK